MKRFISIFCVLIFFLNSNLFGQILSNHQMIPADHWIYNAISILERENGNCDILDCAPLSVNELKNTFNKIDVESLSASGRVLYNKVDEFLSKSEHFWDLKPVKLSANVILYPELMYKSNDEIDWTFATDYSGDKAYNYKTNKWEQANYGAASNYSGNKLTTPFLQLPVYIDFADYVFIEGDFFVGKSFWAMSDDKNFTNIFWSGSDLDFLWPTFAYASTGKLFDNGLGISFHVGKQGLQIGRTLTGSIIYNDTFQTDYYAQLNLYSKNFKLDMNVVQVSPEKFLYLHTFEIIPFKWFRLGVLEGTLLDGSFELRYLNPLMIFHSFGSWTEYKTALEDKYYAEAHSCAYMGINFDVVPVKNLRIYGLFAQTEIQPPNELTSEYGRTLPNGMGGQFGAEYSLPEKHDGYFTFAAEGFYLSPFLYIKQSDDWTLYKKRYNMQTKYNVPICSWIGSPFGPDSAGFEAKVTYEKINKWNASAGYLFVAHGTNSFGMLEQEYKNSDGTWSAFYPSVLVRLGLINQEQAESIARTMALTGVLQYTNQIMLSGSYILNNHFSFDAGVVYSFIFNNMNVEGAFAQGVQLSTACEIKLF